jgi:hypothetical protein
MIKVLEGSILAQLFNKLLHVQQERKYIYLIKGNEIGGTKKCIIMARTAYKILSW